MLTSLKSRKLAMLLAFAGVMIPGLHKFYLGQPRWGVVYLMLWLTPISRAASLAEGVWYLLQSQETFDRNFNAASPPLASVAIAPEQVGAIAEAMRHLDQLRQEGLMTEYEFEQKRRQLLDRIV